MKAATTLSSLLLAYQCQPSPAPGGSETRTTAAPGASSALAPVVTPTTVEPVPWFAGKFKGSYRVERHIVERSSVQPAWVRDDGSRWSGDGSLVFECDSRGLVRGSASGALGTQRIAGAIDERALTFRLQGEAGLASASGTVVCPEPRPGREISCTVQASSADGNFVRAGSARLLRVVTSPR